jgi:hypothetical protein
MGLCRGKVQSISRAFIFCQEQTIKEHQCIKRKRYVKKREREKNNGKVSIKKHSVPHLGLGGLHRKKRREELLSVNYLEKHCKRQYMEQVCI